MTPRPYKSSSRTKPSAMPRFQVEHHTDREEIKLYQASDNAWVSVLAVHDATGFPAKAMAVRIAQFLSQDVAKDAVLQNVVAIFDELLLDGLTFSTEQDVEHTARNIRRILS